MFNKELKKEVKNIKSFLKDANILLGDYPLCTAPQFDGAMRAESEIRKANKRISELEAKIDALMELLAVKEVQPETERKLVKGNKEVVIGKKHIVWVDLTE